MGACLAAQTPSRAALVASDYAGNYNYNVNPSLDTSWPQTNNLGTGFGNWSFINSPNGGSADEFQGASGINSGNGLSFGLLANSAAGSEAQAILPFLGGSLAENQMFSVQMQNGSVANDGGQVGFRLQNSSGGNIFQFYLNGNNSVVPNYFINVSGVLVDTGLARHSRINGCGFHRGVVSRNVRTGRLGWRIQFIGELVGGRQGTQRGCQRTHRLDASVEHHLDRVFNQHVGERARC